VSPGRAGLMGVSGGMGLGRGRVAAPGRIEVGFG
jgi:hypothetical protein